MKLLHLADIHSQRSTWDKVEASLDVAEKTARDEAVDLVVIAGDTAEGPLQNSERDVFDALAGRIQRLGDIAPVAIIYGTPTHDAPGSLEVFEKLKAAHPIVILRPGVPYFLTNAGRIEAEEWSKDNPVSEGRAVALLFGVPEPSKKWLLAGAGATGKDATDESVRAALRALFLGLGGMRREHAHLPCVLLYHGGIVGATAGSGYEVGGGIAITQDDLAAVGADYYALGHIHDPQQIRGLPAYYAGSVYPSTWGETHKAGCNLVEIDGDADEWSRIFTRIDFPHPVRHKYATTAADPIPGDAEGLAWVEITATREEAAGLDRDELLSRLVGHNALPGSIVTINVLPTETVRAAEIAERHGLADKVRVWGEASETPISDAVIAKAKELEAEFARAAGGVDGSIIRIDRLRLRGAVGIWKKSRKDEIDIDFAALGEGVVALIGPNGYGKTTILENLQAWACMLTREGALKDHFRLKDSARELWFTDERTGWKYRALISIRADIASGAAEYFLYVDKGAGEEPAPGITGRKEPYEAAVTQLFGSLEMYLRTAFSTQRPTRLAPDLSTATQGQRKALFVELAGIDYLERHREAAKARGDALESEIITIEAAVDAAAGLDDEEEVVRGTIAGAEAAGAAATARKATAEEEGHALANALETSRAKVTERQAEVDRRDALTRQVNDLEGAIAKDQATAQSFRAAADGLDKARAKLDELAGVEAEVTTLRDQRDQHNAAYTTALNLWGDASRDLEARRGAIRLRLELARKSVFAAERDIAAIEGRISAPIADHCPTCRQLLPEAERSRLAEERTRLEGEKSQIEVRAADARKTVQAAEAELAAVITPPEPERTPFPGADRLQELQRVIADANTPGLRAIIQTASEAQARIGALEETITGKKSELSAAQDQLKTMGAAADLLANAKIKLQEAAAAHEAKQEEYAQARADEAAHAATLTQARARLDQIEKARAGVEEKRTRVIKASAELEDWRLLERAVGPNGIQALELDALSPSISTVANRLLAEAYGNRYQINFRTQRVAGSGKKTKLVEDFEIFVLDTEDGSEQPIDTLSGGERVWILKALTDGFSIIRARNTGTRFQTMVLDEADGALDPEAKMLYLRMVEAAHRESGRAQTILVSHSTEIQAMVDKTINVAELGPRAAARKEIAA